MLCYTGNARGRNMRQRKRKREMAVVVLIRVAGSGRGVACMGRVGGGYVSLSPFLLQQATLVAG